MHDANPERVRSALSFLNPHDRRTWVKMAFAIKSDFGEDGFEIWDEWGSQHKRPAGEVKSTWKSAKPGGKVGLGSLFFEAKAAGWKDDTKYEKPSAAVIAQRQAAAAARQAAYEAEEAAAQEAAAQRAQAMLAAAAPAATHPYLASKSVASHGLSVGAWEYTDASTGEVYQIPGCLLIPMLDRKRRLHGLQCIEPSLGKPKRYLKDCAKRGKFFPIGKPKMHEGRRVFVFGEGYATCASVHESTGHMVLVCFDASNLLAVAQTVREADADAILLFAADNDLWNRRPDGTPENPGIDAATKAAKAVGGLVVPPPFCDGDATGRDDKGHLTGPKDWNDWHGINGADSVAEIFAQALAGGREPDPDPEPEPEPTPAEPDPEPPASTDEEPDSGMEDMVDYASHFAVLGYDRGLYYVFQHEQRQIIALKPSEVGSDSTMAMLAPREFWENHFPGEKPSTIDKRGFMDWFFRLAPKRGIFDNSCLRGRGAWIDDGRTVYHHGRYISVNGEKLEVGQIKSRFVYELARTLPMPADEQLSDADGARLVEIARMFRWSKPGAAALLAGWTFLAPICGALRWRPHIWLTGGAGTGKSTVLNDYVHGLLGDLSLFAQGSSSEAGIRQTLKADALPVLFDESEQNNDGEKRRIEGVLALIRQASTESTAKTLKGTISGGAMNFHIRSMFCLASIQVGMEHRADRDRLTQLTLLRPPETAQARKEWEDLKEALYFIGRDPGINRRLLRRAIELLPVCVHQNIAVFIAAAAKAFGSQRKGDQYGTLLAGCWCMASSKVATPAEADAMIASYDWNEFLEPGEVDDSEKALRAIMEAKIAHKGDVYSVATVVTVASNIPVDGVTLDAVTALRLMRDNGMNISAGRILFQNDSTALRKLVADTPFAVDLRGQLLRVPGAMKMEPRRFAGGSLHRSVGVPLHLVVNMDEPPI